MASEWQLLLSRDGTVLVSGEGAPASWVGTRLDKRDDVPADLKDAVQRALDSAQHSASPVAASVSGRSLPQPVHLTVIDAIPLRRVPTDLRGLMRSALEMMQRQAKAFDVTLKVTVDDNVPSAVLLDGEKIAWAVTVLVGNALRYVHHGSQVMPGGSISVHVTFATVRREVSIGVQDDGAGIPPDKLRLLFSAGPDQPRVGLGLPMIREVVAAHAGHLDVQSDPDTFRAGTTIRLTLPA